MNGYAQPDTCFMFAYDLENEKLLWRSADQTYNSMNFLVKGEVIDRLPLKKMRTS